jgi:hypothetical protein
MPSDSSSRLKMPSAAWEIRLCVSRSTVGRLQEKIDMNMKMMRTRTLRRPSDVVLTFGVVGPALIIDLLTPVQAAS